MNSQHHEENKEQASHLLNRKEHTEVLKSCLTRKIPPEFEHFVPVQTWCVYWITHSLSLLGQEKFFGKIRDDVIKFMSECCHPAGGYGGGPGQIGHLATSYAAVNALITVSGEKALDSIDRVGLIKFLHDVKQPDGSFAMHIDGETDSRATYCALVILKLLNIHDEILLEDVATWILSCQTYEGGFGSVPGSEAHGGYTFCCVASLCLLNQLRSANLSSLLRWLTRKQLETEGGFCGRSNKLVDSCYSFWQGAIFPMIHAHLSDINHTPSSICAYMQQHQDNLERFERSKRQRDPTLSERAEENASSSETALNSSESKGGKGSTRRCSPSNQDEAPVSRNADESRQERKARGANLDHYLSGWLFDCCALQNYVLDCCQATDGLLKDKPGVEADIYHTCYALSGLSISQHQPDGSVIDVGSQSINLLAQTHPLFNLNQQSLENCFMYFRTKMIETAFSSSSSEPEDEVAAE